MQDVQQLGERVRHRKADNERLRQQGCFPGQGLPPLVRPRPQGLRGLPLRDWSSYQETMSSVYNGKTGLGIAEWAEKVQGCVCACHHSEGEAKEERKFSSGVERGHPVRVLAGATRLCSVLRDATAGFGETLQGSSLVLVALMGEIKRSAPDGMPSADVLLRDQFTEHVLDSSLQRELKHFVRSALTATLLELRGQAIKWEREGLPGGIRGRSLSLPSAYALQFGVQGRFQLTPNAARVLRTYQSAKGISLRPRSKGARSGTVKDPTLSQSMPAGTMRSISEISSTPPTHSQLHNNTLFRRVLEWSLLC